MKNVVTLGLAVVIVTLGFFYSAARAESIAGCQNLIDQTGADLAGVTIGGNHPDRTRDSLQSKLDGASAKLAEGKFQDAIDKLVDFSTAVEQMTAASKPKIGPTDAELLVTDANNAVACLQSLLAGG